jgi:hypothetical protein
VAVKLEIQTYFDSGFQFSFHKGMNKILVCNGFEAFVQNT